MIRGFESFTEGIMSKVLYIKASPMKERSYSVAVADAFVEAYKKSASQRRSESAGPLRREAARV